MILHGSLHEMYLEELFRKCNNNINTGSLLEAHTDFTVKKMWKVQLFNLGLVMVHTNLK